jgi:hypothetical protein
LKYAFAILKLFDFIDMTNIYILNRKFSTYVIEYRILIIPR